jgi:hypothetical protein
VNAVLPADVSLWCLRTFAPAAVAGALIALSAPMAFVRVLGIVALVASVLGLTLHIVLLQRDHPTAWNELRAWWLTRFEALRSRFGLSSKLAAPTVGGGV